MRLTAEQVRTLVPGAVVSVTRYDHSGRPYRRTCEVVRMTNGDKALRYLERGRFKIMPIGGGKYFREG